MRGTEALQLELDPQGRPTVEVQRPWFGLSFAFLVEGARLTRRQPGEVTHVRCSWKQEAINGKELLCRVCKPKAYCSRMLLPTLVPFAKSAVPECEGQNHA